MKTSIALFAVFALLLTVFGFAGSHAVAANVDFAGNLAKVPETDPKPKAVPQLVPGIKGQHPRLLFTKKEIKQLKKQIPSDPILKAACDETVSWAKRFRLPKEDRPGIVLSDTPALANGVGRYPALVYAYALNRDPAVKKTLLAILEMMLDQPYWADTAELDCNMGAGNNMLMVALIFDVLYDDLEPKFRLKVARKILTHVRRMYYLGYQQRCLMPTKYWQQDPQNNHRWHRNAGMTACLLAIADMEELETGFLLQQHKKEMDFIFKWLPDDGTCHEGTEYQTFGFFYLAAAAMMMDRAMGTEYLKHPGLRDAWAQQIYYGAPGRRGYMSFGDAKNGEGYFGHLNSAFFIGPHLNRDGDAQAALVQRFQAWKKGSDVPWTILTFYDPTIAKGNHTPLPTYRLFADLGAATMRDSWKDDAVLLTFKCGPYGGYKLNEYAHAHKDEKGKPHYVNVAHDDPDANSFTLGTDGVFFFHPGNYATKKLTETNNTITVDGVGQLGEGNGYTQPVANVDMRNLSYLTAWKVGKKDRIIVEGEAGNAYKPLDRFRRTIIWMPKEYILILDDVRALKNSRITWRGTSEKAQFENPEDGRCYAYTKDGKRLDFQMLANKKFNGSIDHMFLSGRWSGLQMLQFQFFQDTSDIKFACLLDPWKKKVGMELTEKDNIVTLTVKGNGINDRWTWRSAKNLKTPSLITGHRGKETLITLSEKDVAPQGD